MAETDWRLASEAMIQAIDNWENPEMAHEAAARMRAAVEPTAYVRYQRAMSQWDVSDMLANISCPTLVMHPKANAYFPVDHARRLATNIPGAQLALVESSSVLIPDMEVAVVSGRFLLGGDDRPARERPQALPQGTAVILFTDIADSTALTERLGDVAFRDASRSLDLRLRDVIRDASGSAIDGKLLGDGVMAVFSSASQAIDAARRCVALSAESELRLHVGLHAGDVIREGGNVYGGAVNIAARVCGESAPGEVLVSGTVRELARTSAGVSFEDRGEHTLKGIDDAVRLYEVRWRE